MAAIKLKVLHYYYHLLVLTFTATSELSQGTGFETQIPWFSICDYVSCYNSVLTTCPVHSEDLLY